LTVSPPVNGSNDAFQTAERKAAQFWPIFSLSGRISAFMSLKTTGRLQAENFKNETVA
jgi:hypothetical protein